jgi:hypothetical protein
MYMQVFRCAAATVVVALLALTVATSADAHGAAPLKFGIYAGGMAGLPSGALTTGPPDDPTKIQSALDQLQDGRKPFLVRVFTAFADQPAGAIAGTLPANGAQYAVHGRKLDLVLGYSGMVDSQAPWNRWVKDMVHAYGPNLGAIQITEEANILNPPDANGAQRARQAVVTGVLAADEQLRRDGLRRDVSIGASVAEIGINDSDFWRDVGRYATPRFRSELDYVGVDMYPDFITPEGVAEGLATRLRALRRDSLPLAGLGRVALRVTEHGWPTGPGRTEAEQVRKLIEGVLTVNALRVPLGITHYEWWDLRDADSTFTDPWYQFGLLHSDYAPKPAFEAYRKLIERLG